LAAESKHHVVWRGNLARQRIEQHAHIPYTHGFRSVYDEFSMTIQQTVGVQTAMRFAFVQSAMFHPHLLIRTG
jgi:hypothetical protein